MPAETWFLFDLGNTVLKLAYERVLENLRRGTDVGRDELVDLLEQPGGYRDLERGTVTFWEFYEFLTERADYRGSIGEFHEIAFQPIAGARVSLDRDGVDAEARDDVCSGGSLRGQWTGGKKRECE